MTEANEQPATTSSTANKELLDKIRDQVEFYFGDANLNKDRFLGKLIYASEGGYVEVQTIANFNKMKSMTTDVEVVKEAIKGSDLLELDSTGTKIRRTKAVKATKDATSRTVYTEAFPENSTHDSLKELFSICGKVVYVSMPRNSDPERTFKGFAFIEYDTEEGATRAAKELNTVENPDHNPASPPGLRVISKDTWDRFKDEYKLQRSKEQQQHTKKESPPPGLIMHISNIGGGVQPPEVKATLKAFGQIKYLDMRENGEAYARFATAESAQQAATKMTKQKLKLGNQQITVRIVTGEEEESYWQTIYEAAKEATDKKKAERMEQMRKKIGDAEGGEQPPTKKQKVSKTVKEKGRRDAKISGSKPTKHIFFEEEGEGGPSTSSEPTGTATVAPTDTEMETSTPTTTPTTTTTTTTTTTPAVHTDTNI